jgi:NAD(P)-dependent dehydrogenase (short-subunit alcohol dehydrogenase family)
MSDRITSAFGAFSTAREVAASHDLTGKSVLITGAATGLGFETARALAERGAKIIIGVRKPDLGAAAADEIAKTATGPKPVVEYLDLSDLKTLRDFGERWGRQKLHIMINNAAVMACPLSRTADDLEMQIGTNHFGHYLLTLLMAPSLQDGALDQGRPARLVVLSSIGHRRSPVNFEDMHYRQRPYEKWEAYGQAKTANSLFAVGFHKRFAAKGVTANAVHPGGIMTPLQRHLPREEMIAMGWMDEAGVVAQGFKTPEQGASTSTWAALGAELEGKGGLYLEDCNQAEPAATAARMRGVADWALDPAAADLLWAESVKTTGVG